MDSSNLNSKVLGQLLLMQSVVNNLPNEALFSFVCRGLVDIPGVRSVDFFTPEAALETYTDKQIAISVNVGTTMFGEFVLTISEYEPFEPYKNYVKNFVFMIAIILEERRQRTEIIEHRLFLEHRIEERTLELIQKNWQIVESERRFTELMQNITLLSVILNAQGNVEFSNQYLCTLTGYSESEIQGRNWFDLCIPLQMRSDVRQIFLSVMSGAQHATTYENEILTKSGKSIYIAWNNTILRDSANNIIGTASIGENITARKLVENALNTKNDEYKKLNDEYFSLNEELTESLENLHRVNHRLEIAKAKAEESDRLKTAFLQNMSHEIRTPMNAIMGFSELLPLNYDNKPKLEKFSEIIRQRASDLLDLINDLLDIARIESGQLNLHIDNCTIATVFSELQSFFVEYQTRANKNDIVFLLEMDEITQKLTMRTDRIKLKQIFINLISNAFKFTKTGIIKGGCKLLPDGKIYFYVSDTGIGIPAELQKHVFERFAQIQTNTNAVIVGTGLGLSIVKGLVEILGGKIHLYSIPNVGSTFSFILPRIAASADTQSQTSSSLRPSHTNIFHILLVEDDPANALFLIEILQEANYRVTHVDCAQKALATIKTHSINLVLMDIRLPDVNGYEATSIIKKMYPNLPIIAQTAYATNEDRIKSMTAGCDDYISKPIVKGELYNILNYWLSKVKE